MARLGMSCMSTASCTLIRSCAKHSSLATGTILSLNMHHIHKQLVIPDSHTFHQAVQHLSHQSQLSARQPAWLSKLHFFLTCHATWAGELMMQEAESPSSLALPALPACVAGSAGQCSLARVPGPWYSLGFCILCSTCTAAKLFFTWTVWTELWVLASIMNMHQLHCLMTLQQYTTAAATKHPGSSMLR